MLVNLKIKHTSRAWEPSTEGRRKTTISAYKAGRQEVGGAVESIRNEDANKVLISTKLPNRGYTISGIMI